MSEELDTGRILAALDKVDATMRHTEAAAKQYANALAERQVREALPRGVQLLLSHFDAEGRPGNALAKAVGQLRPGDLFTVKAATGIQCSFDLEDLGRFVEERGPADSVVRQWFPPEGFAVYKVLTTAVAGQRPRTYLRKDVYLRDVARERPPAPPAPGYHHKLLSPDR
jgi:hypothetical protein